MHSFCIEKCVEMGKERRRNEPVSQNSFWKCGGSVVWKYLSGYDGFQRAH
jgi:hypothetical protein